MSVREAMNQKLGELFELMHQMHLEVKAESGTRDIFGPAGQDARTICCSRRRIECTPIGN